MSVVVFYKRYLVPIVFCAFLFLPITSDAFSFGFAQQASYDYENAGFLSGVWHGLLAPYSLLVRLFVDSVEMYTFANTGWFYDAGFLLGITGSLPIGWITAIVALIVTIL